MTQLLRTFVAIELPPQVKRFAGRIQESMRAEGLRLSWVRPENLHLTLKFLGDVEAQRIPEISSALVSAAQPAAPFRLTAGRVGVFPGMRQPRVVWLGTDGQADHLFHLQCRVETALEQVGFAPEKRLFKGHLTLGRVKNRIDPDIMQAAFDKVGQVESDAFTVEGITLFESDLKPAGAVYTRLAEAMLTAVSG